MPIHAKICGLSTPQAVNAALAGQAAYIGFVFFDRSPRRVSPEDAARLSQPAQGRLATVAVTVDPDDALLDHIMATLRPSFIQLHGEEGPERVEAIRARTSAGIIKAIPIAEAADLQRAKPFEHVVDHLMFDAKPPKGSLLPGGMGASFDWDLLKQSKFARPWFLAGGLDPWNAAQAAARSGAPLLDVSSGVERGPGLKDPALITAFLDAVRKA